MKVFQRLILVANVLVWYCVFKVMDIYHKTFTFKYIYMCLVFLCLLTTKET